MEHGTKTYDPALFPLIILNPAANRGKMTRYRSLIESYRQRINVEYVETRLAGEAQELAKQAAHEGRGLVVVGGDGTLNEVMNGILTSGCRVPLGIVPAGSGNDYACNTLKLSSDPETALETALHGRVIETDAGVVNGHYFANAFSVGLDADIAVAVGKLKKYPLMSGARLYYTAALKQLLFGYRHCPWVSLSLDGKVLTHEQQQYVLIAVSNGPAYGAGFRVNPQADHTDGYFDICAVSYMPLRRALKLLPVLQRGEHAQEPLVHFYRAKALSMTCARPANMQYDGETLNATTFEAQILPGALLVRV
ncbi:diacylglycerol/lipid kinase family protein [Ktedonospora formicarum]|uniref:Diacylglycerol kinase n=1 Tax=Ktedonospora formicarum TaxID=2778364 RepID=A0A8J3MXZ9_9CHLR|nr:diacylglycerol kinase family protein [Ktedonospora formicarum]GHO50263.1 diacylglycerol kinase [Ktedonospora formicarum]